MRERREGGKEGKATYRCFELLRQVRAGFLSCFERDVAVETVAFDVVRDPDDRGFGHAGVLGLREGGRAGGCEK